MGNESKEPVYMTGKDFLRDAQHCNIGESNPNEASFRAQFSLDRIITRGLESWSIVGGQMVGAEHIPGRPYRR